MKNLKDIENLSFWQLESIADETSVEVPEQLKSKIADALTIGGLKEEKKNKGRRRILPAALTFATVAAASAIIITLSIKPRPKDTFDDPRLAYAEVEKALTYISTKMDKGGKIAEKAAPAIEKPKEIMNKISK